MTDNNNPTPSDPLPKTTAANSSSGSERKQQPKPVNLATQAPLAGNSNYQHSRSAPHPHLNQLISSSSFSPAAVPAGAAAAPPAAGMISVTVAPFTGGPFTVTISRRESVEELKKAVAKKLKVLKDRICLLYRERYKLEI